MKKQTGIELGSSLIFALTIAAPASAHFRLTAPPSWLKEDPAAVGGGGPQKGSPCGPGGIDDKQPIPTSGIVTDFHVGETIELDWVDTIAHPGYFRVALAENRADLKDPTIKQDTSCNFDESMVPKTASGNVLADGILFRTRNGFNAPAGTKFTYMVTLPNTPCDKCTLQVMQVMENDIQGLSNCHYFHCADIRILPAGAPGSGGASGSGSGGNTSGGGTSSTTSGGMTGMLGVGGSSIGTSAGGMLSGMGGLVTTGGGAAAGTPLGSGGSVGTITPGGGAPPPLSAGGANAVTGSGGTMTEVGGTTNGATDGQSSDSSGCAVALRSHAASSALSGFALLALLGLERRRRAGGSRGK